MTEQELERTLKAMGLSQPPVTPQPRREKPKAQKKRRNARLDIRKRFA